MILKRINILLSFVLILGTASSICGQNSDLYKPKKIEASMLKAAKWQFNHPKHELYSWTNGAFYAGVSAAYRATGSKNIYKEMIKMGEANQWKAGPRLHHADDHAICQTYIDLFRIDGDSAKIRPFISTMDAFMNTAYQTELPMRPIVWWWCDALFMAPPSYVKLGLTLNEEMYLNLSDKLYKECYDLLYDKEEHLFARDIRYKSDQEDILKEANGEKIFWSRGNGWVMGGLTLLLKELPQDYKNRPFYEKLYKEMSAKIASLQQDDGLWRSSLLDPTSYPGGEASGSGFYCYALAYGVNSGILDEAFYLPVVKKAWAGLNSLIQEDGHIGWVQPIGADPRKDFSADSWEVYGTGAFLLAGSEMLSIVDRLER